MGQSFTHISRTADQVSHRLIRQMLRGVLREPVASSGVGPVAWRATAALYALVMAHPVDRRGRCAWCGWAGVVFGRRRRCRIYRTAHYWVHQPTPLLAASLTEQLGVTMAPLPVTGPGRELPNLTITDRSDRDDTDQFPVIETVSSDPPDPDDPNHQAPALSSGGDVPTAGWPDPDHGGTEVLPDRPRFRRGPPEEPPPGSPVVGLIAGGALCPA